MSQYQIKPVSGGSKKRKENEIATVCDSWKHEPYFELCSLNQRIIVIPCVSRADFQNISIFHLMNC